MPEAASSSTRLAICGRSTNGSIEVQERAQIGEFSPRFRVVGGALRHDLQHARHVARSSVGAYDFGLARRYMSYTAGSTDGVEKLENVRSSAPAMCSEISSCTAKTSSRLRSYRSAHTVVRVDVSTRCAVMRTRVAARRIGAVEHVGTIESLEAASALRSPRNWKLDVRPITLSFAPRDKR